MKRLACLASFASMFGFVSARTTVHTDSARTGVFEPKNDPGIHTLIASQSSPD